jgi:hypothetical protein
LFRTQNQTEQHGCAARYQPILEKSFSAVTRRVTTANQVRCLPFSSQPSFRQFAAVAFMASRKDPQAWRSTWAEVLRQGSSARPSSSTPAAASPARTFDSTASLWNTDRRHAVLSRQSFRVVPCGCRGIPLGNGRQVRSRGDGPVRRRAQRTSSWMLLQENRMR